jgi:hypothetical protein
MVDSYASNFIAESFTMTPTTTTSSTTSQQESPIRKQVITIFLIIFVFGAIALSLSAGIAYYVLPRAIEEQKARSESSAVITLKIISDAQQQIKQNDKDGNGRYDYSDLKTLGVTGSINPSIATGRRNGYNFETAAGTKNPEKTWWAKASPREGSKTPFRFFFMNQSGLCYESKKDFQVNKETAELPAGVVKLDVSALNKQNK